MNFVFAQIENMAQDPECNHFRVFQSKITRDYFREEVNNLDDSSHSKEVITVFFKAI